MNEHGQIVIRKNVRYEHTKVGMGDKQTFWEPQQVILLGERGACGRCPISLVCHSGGVWDGLCKEFVFAVCARCFAVGIRQLNSNVLYLCTLLRSNRVKKRWECRTRNVQRRNIINNINIKWHRMGFGGFGGFGKLGSYETDIPYSCAARCRYRGVVEVNLFNSTLDCRTTISNVINEIVRY